MAVGSRSRRQFCRLFGTALAIPAYARLGIAAGPVPNRRDRLVAARTWMMQLDDLDEPDAVARLEATTYPLLVLEAGLDLRDDPYDPRPMLSRLRTTPAGATRLLLANVDVGNAESSRTYWRTDWSAPTRHGPGRPDFLLGVDPDGWTSLYPVAFWDPRWKALWLGEDGAIARLARAGFDGVCLEGIDVYDDDTVAAEAERRHIDPDDEMIRFVEEIRAAGRRVTPDFLIVPYNAHYLLDSDPVRYTRAIDALIAEDTWFNGQAEAAWEDPRAGDLHQRHDGEESTERRLAQCRKFMDRGVPVFSVDYCVSRTNAALVYREARKAGLRPLVTRVALSRLTDTPPEAFQQ